MRDDGSTLSDARGNGATVAGVRHGVSGAGEEINLFVIPPNDGPALRIELSALDPAFVKDWRGWGTLEPMTGGYLLIGSAAFARLSDDGSVTFERVPTGYLVQAGTRDPDLLLVGKAGEDNGPTARSIEQTGLYLWKRTDGSISPLNVSATDVAQADRGLAWIRRSDGRWLLLTDGRQIEPWSAAFPGSTSISPNGERIAVTSPAVPTACAEPDSSPSCGVDLRSARDGADIGIGPGRLISDIVWMNNAAVYGIQTPERNGALVVLDDSRSTTIPVPDQ